ncbi:hypothetical protein Tco_1186767 [Tanacetum coccineum]
MDFPEFCMELEAHFGGAGSKLIGIQLLQLEIRLKKTPSKSLGASGSPPCGCVVNHLVGPLVLVMTHETKA